VAQLRGKTGKDSAVQVTATQLGSAWQIFWQPSGVSTPGVTETKSLTSQLMFGLRHEGKAGRVETMEVVVELFDELVEVVEEAAVKLVREQMLIRARNARRLLHHLH